MPPPLDKSSLLFFGAHSVTDDGTTQRDEPEFHRPRLGQLLIGSGVVSDTDIEAALAAQLESSERLGEILVREGKATQRQVYDALAGLNGVEFVDLDDVTVDPHLLNGIRESFTRRKQVLPIALDGDDLVVAMVDPGDVFARDDLAIITGKSIRTVMAEASQLADALDRVWGKGNDQEEILRIATEQVEDLEGDAAALAAVREAADDAPVVQFVNQLLTRAVAERASDVHLEPTADGLRVRFRIDGVLRDVMTVPRGLVLTVTSRMKIMANVNIAERRRPQDGRMTLTIAGRPVSGRIVTLPTPRGESVVLRLLEESSGLLNLDELAFDPSARTVFEDAIHRPWGAILVTGPTGSGKSTTLYASLGAINDPGRNIVTVEDPIEYELAGIKQVQLNMKAGLTFAAALRSILRADPDVVLVGEIRDLETARISIEAALTGHLMLSSLHTNNAASAPMRLVDMGVQPFLVTATVTCVVAQRLARRLCVRCREQYEPTKQELERLGLASAFAKNRPPLWRPRGCPKCSETGYRGRVALQEVLSVTDEIQELILDRAGTTKIENTAIEQGMVTMRDDGLRKAAAGLTSVREVLRAVG